MTAGWDAKAASEVEQARCRRRASEAREMERGAEPRRHGSRSRSSSASGGRRSSASGGLAGEGHVRRDSAAEWQPGEGGAEEAAETEGAAAEGVGEKATADASGALIAAAPRCNGVELHHYAGGPFARAVARGGWVLQSLDVACAGPALGGKRCVS